MRPRRGGRNLNGGSGTLTVRIESPDPYSYDQPIAVIDSSTLELVRTATCNEELPLPAGSYVVSATLPTGTRAIGVAEVAPDTPAELTLTLQPDEPAAPSPEPPAALEAAPDVSWSIRFRSRTQDGTYEPDTPHVAVLSRTSSRVELSVGSGAGPLFAQVAAPDEVPLTVALPVYGPTVSHQCTVTLERDPPAPTKVGVSLPDNPRIDAIARYLQSGHLEQAATVAGDAEQLLQQKMADPYGAALGGYALLRLNRLDRLHHWPRNLSDYFPWLPDGAVIAGEEAALEGDHAAAIGYVCEAGRRGFPLFAVGLSLLGSRLREYAGAPAAAFGENASLLEEAKRQLEAVLGVMPFAEFDRVSLAFRGADIGAPATSQTPLAELGDDGWLDVKEL